jgi:hypothetical protein
MGEGRGGRVAVKPAVTRAASFWLAIYLIVTFILPCTNFNITSYLVSLQLVLTYTLPHTN